MHHRKLRVDSFWLFGVTRLEPICTQAQEGEAQGLQMHLLLVVKVMHWSALSEEQHRHPTGAVQGRHTCRTCK